jgi:hypothetical protein
MNRITCSECQHANEPERVYCHNCGARLDRTKVLQEKAAQASAESQNQRKVRRMLDPRRGRILATTGKLLKIVVGAAICAAIVVMLLAPEVPPEPKDYTFAPMINMDITSALESRRTAPLVYDQAQVNSFIAANLRRKDSPAKQGYFPLERVLVRFEEGLCAITTERTLFGFPIYSGGSYRVSIDNGKLVATSNGGFIGRLSLPPAVMRMAGPLLEKTWSTLERERNSISKLAGIEFHPQSVSLIAAR